MDAEHADSARLNDLSGQVVGCTFTVLNTLGAGLLEKVYENAPAQELRDAGLVIEQQCSVKVTYHGGVVGDYSTDLLVEGVLLAEMKAVRTWDDGHRVQRTNYLRATGLQLCLLLNFGKPRLEIKRVVRGL
ncbi:MAG TPA: GxxExxY protein [Acetobacteraceae bacterium]|jgi:GxxExxY protein